MLETGYYQRINAIKSVEYVPKKKQFISGSSRIPFSIQQKGIACQRE